jgi:hypothetical protein
MVLSRWFGFSYYHTFPLFFSMNTKHPYKLPAVRDKRPATQEDRQTTTGGVILRDNQSFCLMGPNHAFY